MDLFSSGIRRFFGRGCCKTNKKRIYCLKRRKKIEKKKNSEMVLNLKKKRTKRKMKVATISTKKVKLKGLKSVKTVNQLVPLKSTIKRLSILNDSHRILRML